MDSVSRRIDGYRSLRGKSIKTQVIKDRLAKLSLIWPPYVRIFRTLSQNHNVSHQNGIVEIGKRHGRKLFCPKFDIYILFFYSN